MRFELVGGAGGNSGFRGVRASHGSSIESHRRPSAADNHHNQQNTDSTAREGSSLQLECKEKVNMLKLCVLHLLPLKEIVGEKKGGIHLLHNCTVV